MNMLRYGYLNLTSVWMSFSQLDVLHMLILLFRLTILRRVLVTTATGPKRLQPKWPLPKRPLTKTAPEKRPLT